jgi:NAD(P)-dependent dehydrogenase (short-subunit alcohol dehydrogenase family)
MTTPVVLITGALTGIGRATALAFAEERARIVVSARRDEEGKALAAELHALGVEAEFIRADVRHEDDVRGLVDRTVARFGQLDIAVNNAGTEGKPGPVTEQSAESYAATFDTNVLGTVLSMKHELRVMQAQEHGSIINLSSTMGHRAAAGASIYTASKHAVEGLTKAAALEGAAFGVRVNAGRTGPDRNRDAQSLHRQRRPESWPDRRRAAQAFGDARGDCEDDRLSHIRTGVVPHRPDRFGRWWEIGAVNASP